MKVKLDLATFRFSFMKTKLRVSSVFAPVLCGKKVVEAFRRLTCILTPLNIFQNDAVVDGKLVLFIDRWVIFVLILVFTRSAEF